MERVGHTYHIMADFCSPCKFRNTDSVATKYCITCQEPQCKACCGVHESSRATRTHLMINITDIDKDSKIDQDLEAFQKCPDHDKEIEFYCTEHNHLLCGNCLLGINGLECKSIVEISSAGEGIVNAKLNNQIKTDLDSVIVHCIEEKKKIQKLIQSSETERKDIQRSFDDIKKNIAQVLDKYEKRILEKVDENIKTQLMELNKQLDTLSDTLKTAKENKAKLQTVINTGSKADIFRCTLSVIGQLDYLRAPETVDKATMYKHSLKLSTALSFLIKDTYPVVTCEIKKSSREYANYVNLSAGKQRLLDIAHQVELKVNKNPLPDCLYSSPAAEADHDEIVKGSIAKSKTATHDKEINIDDEPNLPPNTLKNDCDPANIRIAHVSNVRINTPDNKLPTIDGITTLHDGRLILSDKTASRLIILKENFTYDHELLLSEPPGNLTVLTQKSIAVCLSTAKSVTIISTDVKLKQLYDFKTKYSPVGIYAIDKNRLFVSSVDDKKCWYLNVLTPKGVPIVSFKNMQSVVDAKHISSLKITSNFRYYLFCCNVSDFLFCVQADGKCIFRYNVKSPNGLYVDEANMIYVVDSSGTLHLLSATGELLQKVPITADANDITYYPVMDRLVITKQTEPEISVYIVKR